jgi:phosphopantothenate synthetase
MSRPKKFAERTVVAFPADTFAEIAKLSLEGEDRTDFIRAAVELEASIRALDIYPDLRSHLMANETVADFCIKAIRKAVAQRKRALSENAADE